MSSYRWTLAGAACFLFAAASAARASGDSDPLFQDSNLLEVRIAAPFTTILKNRSDEDELDGRFQYTDEAGEVVEVDVRIRARGRFRRDKKVCPFPPLRLNFKTSQTKKSLFHKQDKVKLVTHCRDKARRYEQSLLREYVAYRILNELTEFSFKVRLLRVTYVDTDGDDTDRVNYAFLIESDDRLAKRLDLSVVDLERTKVSALQPAYMNLISTFHYLIGNTDFSPIAGADAVCCHNHVLLGKEGELIFSVPYDFDQAGLVDAPYASANPRFKLNSVRKRLYRGRCANNEKLDATIAMFNDKRDAILKLASQQEGLDSKTSKVTSRYLASFFATIDVPKRVQSKFVKKCI